VLEPQRQRKVGGSFVGMHSEAFNPYMNEYSPIDTALTMKQTAAQRRESEQRRKESVNEQNEYKKMIKMTGDKQIKAFDILADRTASRAIQLQTQRKMSLDDGQFTPSLPKEK